MVRGSVRQQQTADRVAGVAAVQRWGRPPAAAMENSTRLLSPAAGRRRRCRPTRSPTARALAPGRAGQRSRRRRRRRPSEQRAAGPLQFAGDRLPLRLVYRSASQPAMAAAILFDGGHNAGHVCAVLPPGGSAQLMKPEGRLANINSADAEGPGRPGLQSEASLAVSRRRLMSATVDDTSRTNIVSYNGHCLAFYSDDGFVWGSFVTSVT